MGRCLLLGIDEAGRGPVVGDMFQVGVAADQGVIESLFGGRVRDSKRLGPRRRDELARVILERAEIVVINRFPPKIIDSWNLNKLLGWGLTKIIAVVAVTAPCVDSVFIDEIKGVNTAPLERLLPGSRIVMEAAADSRYAIVAAASIVAKFLREQHVTALHTVYGDFGSGYPSDPRTRSWLVSVSGDLPPIVRRSWKTLRRLGVGEGLTKFFKSGRGDES